MAVPLSSPANAFETKFRCHEIESSEQALAQVDIIWLNIDGKKAGAKSIDRSHNIFVGLLTVANCIKEFRSVKRLFTYLHREQHAKIYLILSHAISKNAMLALKKYSEISLIFQFDSPTPWIKEERLEDGSESGGQLISQMIAKHHQLMAYDVSPNMVSTNTMETSQQELVSAGFAFIVYQVLIETLLRLPNTEESKNDFINYCRQTYSENNSDIEAIARFESTYTIDKTIEWYTKSSFVYRILSRTFSAGRVELIYKIRYFVCNLYKELQRLHAETIAVFNPRIRVYRGKKMTVDEFHKLKASIGSLVITKSFLSATFNETVALNFAGDGQVTDGNVSVIFRMVIDTAVNMKKQYAFVGHKSAIKDEDEFLLGVGMIFLNRSVKKIRENVWEVTLTRSTKEEELEQTIIRSKANCLDRAQDVQSIDDFNQLILEALNPLGETVTPQRLEPETREQIMQSMGTPSAQTTSQQTTTTENNRPIRPREFSMIGPHPASRHIWRQVQGLQSLVDKNDALAIVDRTPFDEQGSASLSEANVLIVRILPRSDIYNQAAYRIEIEFPPGYPFDPPEVRFLTPIYHPNVADDGKVSSKILRRDESWNPAMSLVDFVKAVVDLIDHPEGDHAINIEVAAEFMSNRAEFDGKARAMVKEHGLPRK